jgi:hypothetical protein
MSFSLLDEEFVEMGRSDDVGCGVASCRRPLVESNIVPVA